MIDEETPFDSLTPHPYMECLGAHLFDREPHCFVCQRPPEDEIHKEAVAA